VAVVDPKNLHENLFPPPVAIEAIRVNERTYAPKPNLSFGPIAKDLQIDYTTFSLTDAERNRFRYKLEGYDDDWRDAMGRRQAFYSRLPPRPYRFRVIAANNDGVWNETGAAIDFTVEPAIYQTLWFRLLSAVAISAAVLVLYDRRLKRVKAKIHILYQERMRERTRIGRELHDTLLQNICGLALQLDRWSKVVKDPPSAEEGLRELRREAEQWLREAREAVWDLRSQNEKDEDFAEALRQIGEQVIKNTSVQFRTAISGAEPTLPPQARVHLLRILHEGVRNAIRHSSATEIRMEVSYGAEYLVRVRIADNGRGFDPKLASSASGHWGLVTMRERAQKLGAEFKLHTSIGQGTEIEVTVPTVQEDG